VLYSYKPDPEGSRRGDHPRLQEKQGLLIVRTGPKRVYASYIYKNRGREWENMPLAPLTYTRIDGA
jgi:hypothetical protein